MDLFSYPCPSCASNEVHPPTRYATQTHGTRTIYHCRTCDIYYSETFATPMAGLATPLSRIIKILKARSEGMSLNATSNSKFQDTNSRNSKIASRVGNVRHDEN